MAHLSSTIDEPATALPLSEMEIVDTFTQLIFGEGEGLTESQCSIVELLRTVEVDVMLDNTREMGVYLRALGVDEMIKLVRLVLAAADTPLPTPFPVSQHPPAQF